MSKAKAEKVRQKSAAEFFSEHQQIAGFDNPGKLNPTISLHFITFYHLINYSYIIEKKSYCNFQLTYMLIFLCFPCPSVQ